jgi:hypothetical protein
MDSEKHVYRFPTLIWNIQYSFYLSWPNSTSILYCKKKRNVKENMLSYLIPFITFFLAFIRYFCYYSVVVAKGTFLFINKKFFNFYSARRMKTILISFTRRKQAQSYYYLIKRNFPLMILLCEKWGEKSGKIAENWNWFIAPIIKNRT